MRLTTTILATLLASACGPACAHLPLAVASACQRANVATLADRVADPCGYADDLAECAGLPPPERQRILARCEDEMKSPAK